MPSDLREKLAAAFPQVAHQLAFFVVGSARPAYNELDCQATLAKFCAELLPLSPLVDPRGTRVSIVKGNFPKLANLEHMNGKLEFRASEVVRSVESGTFCLDDYKPIETARMRTIFWLPEVIQNPDSIYRNGHKIIDADEVYVRVYNKMGSRVKLVFTKHITKGQRYIRTVPVTSFLTDPEMVIRFVAGQPLYKRP